MVEKGVIRIKRVVLFLLLLMTFTIPLVSAETKDNDMNQLIAKFTEARYKLEAGINYNKFNTLRQDLYVDTKMYLDKYPDSEIKPELDYLITAYNDTADLWRGRVFDRRMTIPKTRKQNGAMSEVYLVQSAWLHTRYPDVMSKSSYDERGGYWLEDVLRNMLINIRQKSQDLKDRKPPS